MAGTGSGRVLRRLAAISVAAVGASFLAAAPALAAGDPPGQLGSSFAIATRQDMPTQETDHPYDIAVTPNGTAYVAWIGATTATNDTRVVNLCTLRPGATTCDGGIQQTSAVGTYPHDMQVLATSGGAQLFWEADSAAGGEIFTADAPNGTGLIPESPVESALPSGAGLLDVTLDPNGYVWALTDAGADTRPLVVYDGQTSTQTSVRAPFNVSNGQLAFAGSGTKLTPIIAVTRYGGAGFVPLQYASAPNGTWTGFTKLAHTWTNGDAGMVRGGKGVRVITGTDDADYRPVIAAWNGKSFDPPQLTSDRLDDAGTQYHDVATDPSGRVADATFELNYLTVTAYPDDQHAAVSRQKLGGTLTYAPQIGESTRGIATVVWSKENGTSGSGLYISRFRLATVSHSASDSSKGGRASVTGPVSCLPVSSTPVGLSAHPAKGWSVRSRGLTLNGKSVTKSYLDGASLPSGTKYTLTGHVVFGKKGSRSTATPSLTFRTC